MDFSNTIVSIDTNVYAHRTQCYTAKAGL